MEHKNPYAPLAMVGVAIPAYATPLVAMSQLGSMFQHANSVGAAFVLLTLGAGINLGPDRLGRSATTASGGAWPGSAILLAVVLALAYAIENPLYPSEIEPPGHTHAFDIYCRPFDAGSSDLPRHAVVAKLKEDAPAVRARRPDGPGSLAATGPGAQGARPPLARRGLAGADAGTHGPRRGLVSTSPSRPRCSAAIALAGLVALSVVGCYAYYPAPREVFEEMSILRGEVLTAAISGNQKHAEHFIPVWDDWTRRLQVGVFLREGSLSPYRRMKAKVFRDRLEFLKHAVEEGDRDEAREYVTRVSKAYMRMRRAFL